MHYDVRVENALAVDGPVCRTVIRMLSRAIRFVHRGGGGGGRANYVF